MKNRRFWIIAVAASVALAVLPAQAVVTKTLVTGNSNCTSVGSNGTQVSVVEPVASTTPFEVPGVVGGKIFMDDVTRRIFDFSTEGVVIIDVIVKGSGSNWYHYNPAVTSDNNLEIPNGNKLNIVHFCYVAAPNNPPVAADDAAGVAAGGFVDIDVLSNDTDADDDALTLRAADLTQPDDGLAEVASGQIRYTPDTGFSGTDTFTYKAFDGTDASNAATVTVTVFAGEIDCGQSTDPLGGDTVPLFTAERGNDVGEEGCTKGPDAGLLFTFEAGLLEDEVTQFVSFIADDLGLGSGTAQFLETIIWELDTPDPGDPQFPPLRYDDHVDEDGLRLMPWCLEDPRDAGVFNGVSDSETILPGTHTSCLVSSSTATNDTGTGLTSTDVVYTVVDGTRAK